MGKVQVVTMGCSKNRVDSEHLLRQISAAGYQISPDGGSLETGEVDTLIINTCGFIKDAKEESIEAIWEAVQAKKRGDIRRLYVMGCLSQRYRTELEQEIPLVDRFFGAWSFDDLLKEMGVRKNPLLENRRFLTTPAHYAYLKVAEGCDRKCSYCAIPGIRGKHVSVPIEALVDEAESLAASGVKELIVIAQDTTFYGLDLYGRRALGDLLKRLIEVKGIEWIRILYSYPASFPEDVLEIMNTSEKMCRYMDIPLQHSADAVLSAMRRSINGAETRALVKKMRAAVPGIVLRTTMMVGHPGEGEKEFQNLLDFVREYKIERLGAFTYSEEEGTWGAKNLKDAVPEEVKQERFEELMEVQAGISLAFNESRIGTCEKVLVDSYSEERGCYVGRTSKECPDADGEVIIGIPADREFPDPVGKFCSVKITGADEYDLYAELLNG